MAVLGGECCTGVTGSGGCWYHRDSAEEEESLGFGFLKGIDLINKEKI